VNINRKTKNQKPATKPLHLVIQDWLADFAK